MVTENNNFRYLILLNLFLGIGISIVAAVGLFDLLYLRMHFDLTWFGVIRSCIYFFPALCYFSVAPLLKGTARSREIVQWAYFIRIWIAVLIPVAALFTDNRHILLGCVVLFNTIAYVAASFANNTLMVLYRQLLPREDFNRKNAIITSSCSISGSLFSLLGAGILSLASDLSNREFYWLFIGLTTCTGIFELWVFRVSRKIVMPDFITEKAPHEPLAARFRHAFAGLVSPVYRQLMLVIAAASFVAPLIDTYICVYLYKVHHASAFTVLLAGNVASFGSNFAGIMLGKWCDRIGYLRFFRQGTFAVLILTLLFGFFNSELWIAIPFLLLVYNGSSGILAGSMCILRNSAAAKLAPASGGESFIAIYSLIVLLSSFVGALLSGWLFSHCRRWTGGEMLPTFQLYYKIVGFAMLLPLLPLYNRGCKLLDKKRV